MDPDCKSLSNCALQIALQTMKDRCQQLQHCLSDLEEENLKLRIDKKKEENLSLAREEESAIQKLNKELEVLNQQKSQLTHHIFMVATENKQLWTKLSLLTEEKLVPEQSIHLIEDSGKADHLRDVDINMEKNLDLIDTCKSDIAESTSMKDLEFNLSLMSVNGDESFEISEMQDQLKQTKVKLKAIVSHFKNQQQMMRITVKHLIQKKRDRESAPPPLCSHCQESRNLLRDKTYKVTKSSALITHDASLTNGNLPPEHEDLSMEDLSPMESAQVCPLCEHMETGQSEFLQHVYSHFGESNEEDDSSATVHPGSNTLEHGAVFPQFNI